MAEEIDIEKCCKDQIYYDAYFGKQSPYYVRVINNLNSGKSTVWNGFAFFFGIGWLLYRKMFLEASIVVAVMILIDLFLDPFIDTNSISYNRFLAIIYGFSIGYFGNMFYVKKANKTISEAKQKFNDDDQILTYLQAKGGTSIISAVIFTLIVIGIILYTILYELN